MTTQFFIISESGQKAGPYDLVGVVKKIRNGSLTADMLVSTVDDETQKPAKEWHELAEFLQEQAEEAQKSDEVHKLKSVSLTTRLRNGWNFLQHNQLSTIFSGLFVLFVLFSFGFVSLAIPPALRMFFHGVFLILIQFFFAGYCYSVLRMVRGQPVDFSFVRKKMSPIKKELILASFIMSFFVIFGLLFILSGIKIISSIGLLITALPGFYMMSLYIFAPLLILDKDVEFWEALEMSRKTVRASGIENIGVIFSLLIINFLAGMAFLIPMIVTLPITIAAISEMFDESFV